MPTPDPQPWQRPGRLPRTEPPRRPNGSNYQPERRIEAPIVGNHHCPHCPAVIRATYRDATLVAVDLVHLHRSVRCRGKIEPQPLEPWLGGRRPANANPPRMG